MNLLAPNWGASWCCTACADEAEGSVVRSPACAAWRWLHSALAREAALFYSLIESAKLCGVKPRAYLREAIRRATRAPGTVTLPRDLK